MAAVIWDQYGRVPGNALIPPYRLRIALWHLAICPIMTFNHPSNYDINAPIASDIEVESCCRTVSVGIMDALRQFPENMFLCHASEWQFLESMILCGGEKYDTPPP